VSSTDCGEEAASSVATRLAEAAPVVVGLKTMVKVQLELAGRDGWQVFDSSENSLALVPENK
jgi:hypothetical protein